MRKVFCSERPWGGFERYTHNETTTVKIIRVAANGRLSLQRHYHREELWTILDEGLKVEVEGRWWLPRAGDKIEVPQGALHRLSNVSDREARIMEISFGVFDEDDIERFEDDYHRE